MILETEQLHLSWASAEDLDAIMALENHPENADFIWQGDRDEHLAEIADPLTELWAMRRPGEREIIGYALARIDPHSNRYELRRIAIGPKDEGLGRIALHALIDHAFRDLPTYRFWLDVYPHNARGIHVYESAGMHRDGILRGNHLDDDGYRDQIIYSLLRPEWQGTMPDLQQ